MAYPARYPGPCLQCGEHRERNERCKECARRRARQWTRDNPERNYAKVTQWRKRQAIKAWQVPS